MFSHFVQFVFLFLFSSQATGLPVCGEFDKESLFISQFPDTLPFQKEFGKLLRNFNESDPEQIERISQLLQNVNPFVSNNLADLQDKSENRVNFVVSQKMNKITVKNQSQCKQQ